MIYIPPKYPEKFPDWRRSSQQNDFFDTFDSFYDSFYRNLLKVCEIEDERKSHSFKRNFKCEEKDSEFVISVEFPGVDPATVELLSDKNTLTVVHKPSHGELKFNVNNAYDVALTKATLVNGLLEIKVPKSETKTNKIKIDLCR